MISTAVAVVSYSISSVRDGSVQRGNLARIMMGKVAVPCVLMIG